MPLNCLVLLDTRSGSRYVDIMIIIAMKSLRAFWEQFRYKDAEQPLKACWKVPSRADWASPAAVRDDYGNAFIDRAIEEMRTLAFSLPFFVCMAWTETMCTNLLWSDLCVHLEKSYGNKR